MFRYFQVKSTLGIHPTRLVNLSTLHQQNLTRLNLGSTLLSLALPLLMLCSDLLKVARGWSLSAQG